MENLTQKKILKLMLKKMYLYSINVLKYKFVSMLFSVKTMKESCINKRLFKHFYQGC